MGAEDFLTTERMDPLVSPGKVAGHVHSVLGGSNFGLVTNTSSLRQSACTSIPIPQDKSAYWFPHLFFQWADGSFSSLNGGAVIYYLFDSKPGKTTAFPDDFRMLSGDTSLRSYNASSFAQQAITFLCLDFNGVSTRHNTLPPKHCPSGIRAQINFPSCWDGKNLDSPDHKSHVAFLSGGPDSGTCSDPKYPITLPRIFIEVYWDSNSQDPSKAMNPTQPLVFANGDPTGYGYHADFINGWDKGVLQKAVDNCHCDDFGSPQCCADQGIFDLNQGQTCRNTKSINETTTGRLPKLPGNNPVQGEGKAATSFPDLNPPALIAPVYHYTGDTPTATGKVVTATSIVAGSSSSVMTSVVHSSTSVPPSSSMTQSSSAAITPPSHSTTISQSLPVSSAVVSPSGSGVSTSATQSSMVVNPPHSTASTASSHSSASFSVSSVTAHTSMSVPNKPPSHTVTTHSSGSTGVSNNSGSGSSSGHHYDSNPSGSGGSSNSGHHNDGAPPQNGSTNGNTHSSGSGASGSGSSGQACRKRKSPGTQQKRRERLAIHQHRSRRMTNVNAHAF